MVPDARPLTDRIDPIWWQSEEDEENLYLIAGSVLHVAM
jgi:hypothetical protein